MLSARRGRARRLGLAGLTLSIALAPAGARAQPAPVADAVLRPERLTAGASNQLMGVLSRDHRTLYFISDDSSTFDLMLQHPVSSGPRRLFDGLGDVAWPQLSPDQERLAYISYSRDSTGDACVRRTDGSGETCLTGAGSAELQVIWWSSDSLAALSRDELHGNYQLRLVPLSGGSPRVLLERNMVGLALSPSREWLAYIPLERRRADVGVTFSNRLGKGLHLQRLEGGKPSGAPAVYEPPLPGATGFPAFSRDGKWLYFSQYLNDTNRDGAIDGNDHSVIFRVGLAPERAAQPIRSPHPEQLTSAEWNCHYPTPSGDQLIMTCSHQGSLDVYSLPIDGAVPQAWTRPRVEGELQVARSSWEKLLLWARLLSLSPTPAQRLEAYRHMVALHLELREHESALFYCGRITKDESLASAPDADRTAWSQAMAALARHRREDLALIRGQLSERYVSTERTRAEWVEALVAGKGANAAALAELVASEIRDDIGDKKQATERFGRVDLQAITDPLVLEVAARRAAALFGLRAEREPLLKVYHRLAEHPALDAAAHLRYARNLIDELLRGVPSAERTRLIADWQTRTDASSELGLLLSVEQALTRLDDAHQEEVRAELFELYKANRDYDRRRALVLSTVQAGARVGNEYVQYQFATTWASWLRHEHPERKYAEELYRSVVLDRGYGELAQGSIGEARGYFFGTTMNTRSLEGHIGFIEARLREGKHDLQELYSKRFAREPNHPAYLFAQAYWTARELPGIRDGGRHEREVGRAIALLEQVDRAWPQRVEVHQLWGYALHQRARRTGSRRAAVEANRHYLLALDLARDNPRAQAALLGALGVLQASMGNHRRALEHFERRAQLPQVRFEAELALHMASARSAFHTGDDLEASRQAQLALAAVERSPKLARFRPLVLDRLALYHWSAGEYEEAVARYNELLPLVDRLAADAGGAPINKLKARLGLAAAALALGDSKTALAALETADSVRRGGQLRPGGQPVWNRSLLHDYRYGDVQLRALTAGMTARAERLAGDLPAAERALGDRLTLLDERFAASDADDDLLALAQVRYQLGELAYRGGRMAEALDQFERGIAQSERYNTRTGSDVNPIGLRLLQAYAELHLYGKVPLQRYGRDLRADLERTYTFICKFPSPNWARYRFLFETYLTALQLS